MVARRFDVFLVALDPALGREIKKTRPAVVVSPDEMNAALGTVLVAPMTSKGFPAPSRVPCRFQGKAGYVVLDQLRAVDRSRLVKLAGVIPPETADKILGILQEMFAP